LKIENKSKFINYLIIQHLEKNGKLNKIYIGQHSSNNENYLGSGTNIKKAIEKYGKEIAEQKYKQWKQKISKTKKSQK